MTARCDDANEAPLLARNGAGKSYAVDRRNAKHVHPWEVPHASWDLLPMLACRHRTANPPTYASKLACAGQRQWATRCVWRLANGANLSLMDLNRSPKIRGKS